MEKRYFLDKVIQMCSNCDRIDTKTFATYKNGKLYKTYRECQDCGYIEEYKV